MGYSWGKITKFWEKYSDISYKLVILGIIIGYLLLYYYIKVLFY